jgi:hypothetical protein
MPERKPPSFFLAEGRNAILSVREYIDSTFEKHVLYLPTTSAQLSPALMPSFQPLVRDGAVVALTANNPQVSLTAPGLYLIMPIMPEPMEVEVVRVEFAGASRL